MSVIAELSIQADQFLLGRVLEEFPDLSVEIERVVPAETRVMPYVWGYGPDLDAFVDVVPVHPNVESIQVLDRLDDRALYKIEWADPTTELITGIAEMDATILAAHRDDRWTFRIRFEDHAGLRRFNRYCADNGRCDGYGGLTRAGGGVIGEATAASSTTTDACDHQADSSMRWMCPSARRQTGA